MKQNTESSSFSLLPDASGYDPIEDRLRANVRATIEALFEEELDGSGNLSSLTCHVTKDAVRPPVRRAGSGR